jgi:hypothetical protein
MQAGYAMYRFVVYRGGSGMASKKRFIRATISLDKDDYAALGDLARRMEVSASWLTRQAIRDFLDKYGQHGQPELALQLADKVRR